MRYLISLRLHFSRYADNWLPMWLLNFQIDYLKFTIWIWSTYLVICTFLYGQVVSIVTFGLLNEDIWYLHCVNITYQDIWTTNWDTSYPYWHLSYLFVHSGATWTFKLPILTPVCYCGHSFWYMDIWTAYLDDWLTGVDIWCGKPIEEKEMNKWRYMNIRVNKVQKCNDDLRDDGRGGIEENIIHKSQ